MSRQPNARLLSDEGLNIDRILYATLKCAVFGFLLVSVFWIILTVTNFLIRTVQSDADHSELLPPPDINRPIEIVWWTGLDYSTPQLSSLGIGLPLDTGKVMSLEFPTIYSGSTFQCRISGNPQDAGFSTDGLIIDFLAAERLGLATLPSRYPHQSWIHFGVEPSPFEAALDQSTTLPRLFNLTFTPSPALQLSHVTTDYQANRLVEKIFADPLLPYEQRLSAVLVLSRSDACWPWKSRLLDTFAASHAHLPVHILGCRFSSGSFVAVELGTAAAPAVDAYGDGNTPVAGSGGIEFGEAAFDRFVSKYRYAMLLPDAFSCNSLPVEYWHLLRLGVQPIVPEFSNKHVYEPVPGFLITFPNIRDPVLSRSLLIGDNTDLASAFEWKRWRNSQEKLNGAFFDRWLAPFVGVGSGYARLCQVLHYLRFDAEYRMHAWRPHACQLDLLDIVMPNPHHRAFVQRATDRFGNLLRRPSAPT